MSPLRGKSCSKAISSSPHRTLTWIPLRWPICVACEWNVRTAICKVPSRAMASAWQHWLLSGASPILVVSPLITGADSARIRARRYVAELCSRAVSVGSRPVEMSRCATSPILLW